MTKTINFYPVLAVTMIILVIFLAYILGVGQSPAFGSAPSGLPATFATSTITSIAANTADYNIAATSTCAARIITVGAGALLSFNGVPPTLAGGVWQAASTTVVYDSGQFGCGAVGIISTTAQTISIIETR